MKEKKNLLVSYVELTLGAIIAAFAIEEFLVPNKIFDGGVTGISMIVSHFIQLPLGIMIVIINAPFVIVAFRKMGHQLVVRMVYAIILFSVMTGVFEPVENATGEMLLAITYGGVLLGLGVGLVLKGGGCLDGTEVVAVILNRNFSISTGQVILIFNVFIFTVAGVVFDFDRGMYSLLMYFISSKVIDVVEIGFGSAKSVMIITDEGSKLADEIFTKLGRTVTFMHGEGLVSNNEKDILYCVVTRAEIYELKALLNDFPGSTFTTISDVSEVVGSHIKSI
ncbi:YitT family protein [Butyrivibrio fibrisolvens]|uniref:YitT family protein n=1 Tax=Pseudobutyrivibrio ruminis TaxID=46206 RepID=UPI00040809F8|nr:YitT family protein [Pseudobutyrivibrio ruminis]MDC7280122.1 YitT family protein [Butyrivibrio fibrisolvens]